MARPPRQANHPPHHRHDTTRYLADAGFAPVFGARPLKRAIQKHLLDPLSLAVLEGGFKDGDHITAEMKNGKVEFVKK